MGNYQPTFSEGSRSGRIVKFSKSGFFWKTYEGEMICDGMKTKPMPNGGTASIANTWYFSIDAKSSYGEDKDKIIAAVQNGMDNGTPVKLKYWSPYVGFPCQGDSGYYVTEVDIESNHQNKSTALASATLTLATPITTPIDIE